MITELAGAYVVGLVPNAALTGLHLYLHRRRTRAPRYLSLEKNLGQLGFFWCETESSIRPLKENSLAVDRAKYRRSALILGMACFFLSWLGFFAQLMIMASIRYLAVSRFETQVMNSKLTELNLSADLATRELAELRELYPKSFIGA